MYVPSLRMAFCFGSNSPQIELLQHQVYESAKLGRPRLLFKHRRTEGVYLQDIAIWHRMENRSKSHAQQNPHNMFMWKICLVSPCINHAMPMPQGHGHQLTSHWTCPSPHHNIPSWQWLIGEPSETMEKGLVTSSNPWSGKVIYHSFREIVLV